MMDKIHNPITNKWVNISGKTGKTVLTNYIKTLNMSGGAKKKKAKMSPAVQAAVHGESAARQAVAKHKRAMLDLPPRFLAKKRYDAAVHELQALDAELKAAIANVGKTRKAEAEAKAAARARAAARAAARAKALEEKFAAATAKALEALAAGTLPLWTDHGGPGTKISADRRTTSKSDHGRGGTAGGERLPMCGAVSLTTAGNNAGLNVGLAAAEKDVSRGGSISGPDTWMISCYDGDMYLGGKTIDNTGEIWSKQIITIEWDQQGVSFLVDGVRRGEKHTWGGLGERLPTGVRVVAEMDAKGSSVSFMA
jgi:hypothetical protein